MENIGKPLGARVLIELEEAEDQVTKRAQEAGLHVVIDNRNKPRPTTGTIVEMGDDPLISDMGLLPGVRVSFGPNAGDRQFINGKEYRLLELQEVKMKLPPLTSTSSS